MNLQEAIEILEHPNTTLPQGTLEQRLYAFKLGIEAMKRCQLARQETSFVGPGLLPGETKD